MRQKFFISFNSADRDKAHWITSVVCFGLGFDALGFRFASRQAYQLPYASQGETPRDRALSRAWKARSRVNGIGGVGDPCLKPKWMRRKTFDRLMKRVEAAENIDQDSRAPTAPRLHPPRTGMCP
jgi:hypothetical protein